MQKNALSICFRPLKPEVKGEIQDVLGKEDDIILHWNF